MTVKRTISVVVGLTQGAIGMLALILVCILYFNLLNIQTTLNVSPELLPLSLLLLGVFAFFSIVSGLFLLHER
ncbi:MAG: hypothetical protein PVF15_11195 [Candidatus Bathyarchaeota archaeon]|jgi:ABC-type Na+ efflux pump permease subunit